MMIVKSVWKLLHEITSYWLPVCISFRVAQGLDEEEGLQLLSASVGEPVEKLPTEAAIIVGLCHGSPMALNIIGTYLLSPSPCSLSPNFSLSLTQHLPSHCIRNHVAT